MINIENVDFKKLNLSGLKVLLQWAKKEGWNPGPFDAEVYWATDPNGFYGFFEGDVLIAGGAIVSYGGAFGFMGLFIVSPKYRGKGIGRKLWYKRRNKLIDRLQEGATIGMDGVVAMQPFYRKGGFEIAFKDERYENMGRHYKVDAKINSIEAEDFENILEYDNQCFGFLRPQFLDPWMKLEGSHAFKYEGGNKIKGFAIVRKVDKGFKIGPLFADRPNIAEELYKACLNSVENYQIYIDIPLANKQAVSLVKKYKAKYVFECARMYYGPPPQIDMSKVYGITTFELG